MALHYIFKLNRRIALLSGILLLLSVSVQAQEQEKLNTGRPDQTQGTYTVKPGAWQLESGLVWLYDKEGEEKVRANAYPEIMLRTGVTNWMELRADIALQDTITENNSSRRVANGVGPLRVGTRLRFWEGEGLWPAVAVLATVTLPVGSSDLKPQNPETVLLLGLSQELGTKMTLTYNLGYSWLDAGQEKNYTVSLESELSDKFSVYGEVYGRKQISMEVEHQLGTGILFLLGPNMQLDVAGAFGLNQAAPDYVFRTGFSVRLPR